MTRRRNKQYVAAAGSVPPWHSARRLSLREPLLATGVVALVAFVAIGTTPLAAVVALDGDDDEGKRLMYRAPMFQHANVDR